MSGQKRETVVDLARLVDKTVQVKLAGGREGASPPFHLPSSNTRL